MRYRSIGDRNVSAYGAILIIAIVAGFATLSIVRIIARTDFTYQSASALNSGAFER